MSQKALKEYLVNEYTELISPDLFYHYYGTVFGRYTAV
jgi:hypothetical protein